MAALLDLQNTTIAGLSEQIRKKTISPVEVIDAFLGRIEAVQPKLNAFITVLDDRAREAARSAETEIVKGRYRGPLHGIPFAAKDLFFTAGIRTTCGSRILSDYVPRETATVITRLTDAGAILIGKTNMHEFAFGPTNHNPHYGDVKNPYRSECISGGSSGGSAAAVAASCALLALGTDTGGSIRIPAALCGLSAVKPTFGRVSKWGVYPLAWSLDHPGPMTKTVEDAAIALSAMAGRDPKDPCTKAVPAEDYHAALTGDIRGIRVGVPDDYYFELIDPEVKALVESAVDSLKDMGAEIRSLHIPDLDEASVATLVLLSAEAAACLEKYHRTRREEIGADVRGRLDQGALHLAGHYIKAQRIRRKIQEHFHRAFMSTDVLVTPGVSIPAPKLTDASVRLDDQDVPVVPALTRCTRIYNLTGLPSVSVPLGFSGDGRPIGMQVAAKPFEEATALKVADAFARRVHPPGPWPKD